MGRARWRFVVTYFFIFSAPHLFAQAPSYAKDIRPIFAKYCLECHNAKALKGGLSLETFKAIGEGSDKGPVLAAGKPDESPLVTSLEGKTKPAMPPKAAKFHPKVEEIARVRAWVTAGAKDDSSLIKVAIPDIKPRQPTIAAVRSVAFERTGSLLALARDKTLEIVDLARGENAQETLPGIVSALAFDPMASRLAIAFGQPGVSGGISVRTVGQDSRILTNFTDLHHDAILDLAFSPDGKLIATAGYDSQIKLLSLGDAEAQRRTLKEHSDSVYAIAFSPDGKRLASCSADRAVKVWDIGSGKLLYTLGEATDWLYTVAWRPDGKHLASAGVDKSIRIYEVSNAGAKLVHSVFAHQAPVQKILYSPDGSTLYSLGQDGVLKAWSADSIVEKKTYDRLPETGLCMALGGTQVALGRYDGVLQILDTASGKMLHELGGKGGKAVHAINARESRSSPGSGQLIKLPACIVGKIAKAGDFAFYRFEVAQNQQLGIRVSTAELGSKLTPLLQLTDGHGKVMADSAKGYLGWTFEEGGTYALGIRDQDFRGGAEMSYRLEMGEIPIVTSVFPLGLERGTQADIHVDGVFLGTDKVRVEAPKTAAVGSKIAVPVTSPHGKPFGKAEVVVGEFPEIAFTRGKPVKMPVPGVANGHLGSGMVDLWQFAAKKGQRLLVETAARRLGSDLDSVLEILDSRNNPVPRALLRCQAKTFVTFRDHDSATANIRIEAWSELGINDMIYVGGELMKIESLPTHPDADCVFFSAGGRRLTFLDTTPIHHSMNEPMYKITVHPPGVDFPPNGYPVFTLYYRNDDGGPGYGRDSRILFDPPADGTYTVRVNDARGQNFRSLQDFGNLGYRLTVRPPRPSFNVRFNPSNPAIERGGALPLQISADRLDGYQGPIRVRFENLPPGFSAPPSTIEAGHYHTDVALFASADAELPKKEAPLRLVAEAMVAGKKISKEATGQAPQFAEPGDIKTSTKEETITLQPGGQVTLTVNIERRGTFKGRVPLEVRGLPHGVRVMDIGLNGILVNENETRRAMVIYAEPWVQASDHPIVVLAKREGKNSEHAAKSVLLQIKK